MAVIRIIVASPSDVPQERVAVERVAIELNSTLGPALGLTLRVSRWETESYPSAHLKGPQGLIDEVLSIPDCDIFIALFWKRFGTPVSDAPSGTAHEFNLAFEAWRNRGRPEVFLYFNQQPFFPQSDDDLSQAGRVLAFKNSLPAELLWWPYEGAMDFEATLRKHLTKYLLDHHRTHITVQSRKVNPRAPIAPLLVDRGVQCDQFRKAFVELSKLKPQFPQIYALPGPVEEDHAGLIQRFSEFLIKPYHGSKPTKLFEPKIHKVQWVEPALTSSLAPLLSRLFSALDAQRYRYALNPELNPDSLVSLLSSMQTPLIIRHDICDEHWCRRIKPLVRDYWEYWNHVGQLAPSVPIVIFFNFVYMQSDSGRGTLLNAAAVRATLSGLMRAIRRCEQNQEPHVSLTLLDELPCIKLPDILTWLEDLGIYSLHERIRRAESLFSKDQPCRTFASIEAELISLQQTF